MPNSTTAPAAQTRRRFPRDLLIRPEPDLPEEILGPAAQPFAALPVGSTVCVKVSAAHDLPYPFAVSGAFVKRVIAEIRAINPDLRLLITEGGVGAQPVLPMAERHGLTAIPGAEFIDAESTDAVEVPNPNPSPFAVESFWLPMHWVGAHTRVLLTSCKLRSHHFQRSYSGGARNLLGLLPRKQYKLASSRRDMRSMVHEQGMDRMVADLYMTAGRDLLTILDGRLLGRQDEHFPLRFTGRPGKVVTADDPFQADLAMARALSLPALPHYMALIQKAGAAAGSAGSVRVLEVL